MPDKYVAHPGMVPAARRSAGTMFAALYGDFSSHPWRGSDPANDAYSLFHQRALAMGWLDNSTGDPRETRSGHEVPLAAPGLWAMNDAGWQHPLASAEAELAAWFQVEVTAVTADRPLPVQPFLQCAEEATKRVGTLHLDAVQILLPLHGIGAASATEVGPPPSLLTSNWFDDCDPRSKARVEVTLDGGQDPGMTQAADQLRTFMRRFDQSVFVCESHSVDGPPPLEPPFDASFWNGPPRHRATFYGALAEWSLDALGWLAGFLADLSTRAGVKTPVLLTAVKAPAADWG